MRRKFKRAFKPLLLCVLAVIFVVLLVVPVRSWVYIGGYIGKPGPFGWTCYCPRDFNVECLCAIPEY